VRLLAEIALVVIAAIGVAICVALLPGGPPTRQRRGRVQEQSRPEQLITLQRLVISAKANTLHVHAYLRPLLAEIAAQRLAAHGYALESIPEDRGRRLLGEPLWEIVRPNRPFPEDRHSLGVSERTFGEMLDVLEDL
jgi:hypothetical protein